MFDIKDRVQIKRTGEQGTVVYIWSDQLRVSLDDERTFDFPQGTDELTLIESAPAPSDDVDPIHDYWLRHAHNAGMAVQALRIINNNATQALKADSADAGSPHTAALVEVEKFSADILRHVFPT